jgi:hypothetical protein
MQLKPLIHYGRLLGDNLTLCVSGAAPITGRTISGLLRGLRCTLLLCATCSSSRAVAASVRRARAVFLVIQITCCIDACERGSVRRMITTLTRQANNAPHQRGRALHSGNHEKLAARPPLHALVGRRVAATSRYPTYTKSRSSPFSISPSSLL